MTSSDGRIEAAGWCPADGTDGDPVAQDGESGRAMEGAGGLVEQLATVRDPRYATAVVDDLLDQPARGRDGF